MTIHSPQSLLRDAVTSVLSEIATPGEADTGPRAGAIATGRFTLHWEPEIPQDAGVADAGDLIDDDKGGETGIPGLNPDGSLWVPKKTACLCNFSGMDQTYRLLICNRSKKNTMNVDAVGIFGTDAALRRNLGTIDAGKCAFVTIVLKKDEKLELDEDGLIKPV